MYASISQQAFVTQLIAYEAKCTTESPKQLNLTANSLFTHIVVNRSTRLDLGSKLVRRP